MILRIKDVLLQLSFCIWFYAEFNRFGDQIPIIEFFRLNETGAPFIALMCKYFRLPSYIQWTNYYIITFLHYPIARTDEGQPRPKYIFNKCGANIYFFTLQRFGPSPSPNFKRVLHCYFYLMLLLWIRHETLIIPCNYVDCPFNEEIEVNEEDEFNLNDEVEIKLEAYAAEGEEQCKKKV